MIQLWVSLPWAGPGAYYGSDAALLARRLDAMGASGVVQGDHLFLPGLPAGDPVARMAADCLTVLTTVAAHSDRLAIATLVANVGFGHPLPLLRRFANLSTIHGGERVYAGLGAGWSRPEFAALGMRFPPLDERIARLAETAHLGRTLFDEGWATQHASHVEAVDLPLAPAAQDPPRLLLGGGSKAVLELAGRYADHVDLAPPPRPGANQFQRPLLATTDDIVTASRTARSGERTLTASLLLSALVVCEEGAVDEEEAALCERVGLASRPLGDCPYALIGPPERLAERVREMTERIGLDWLIVPLSAADRFASEVMPLVAAT